MTAIPQFIVDETDDDGVLIVAFDGASVEGIDTLHRLLTFERVGKTVVIAVVRGAQKLELPIVSSEVV